MNVIKKLSKDILLVKVISNRKIEIITDSDLPDSMSSELLKSLNKLGLIYTGEQTDIEYDNVDADRVNIYYFNVTDIEVNVYKWGNNLVFHSHTLDVFRISRMTELDSDILEGFNIDNEDSNKTFYAYEDDIDDTNVEEEGYGVKIAYAI